MNKNPNSLISSKYIAKFIVLYILFQKTHIKCRQNKSKLNLEYYSNASSERF